MGGYRGRRGWGEKGVGDIEGEGGGGTEGEGGGGIQGEGVGDRRERWIEREIRARRRRGSRREG